MKKQKNIRKKTFIPALIFFAGGMAVGNSIPDIVSSISNIVSADDAVYNGLIYNVSSKYNQKTITIVGCTDDINTDEIVIPDQIDGIPVTAIGSSAFLGIKKIGTLTIGKNVDFISLGNELSISRLNILGEKIGTVMYSAADLKLKIHTVFLGENVDIGFKLITLHSNVDEYIVDEKNTKYCAIDGVLYSADKTNLICYPDNKKIDVFTIPNEVCHISSNSFKNVKKINKIVFSSNISKIEKDAFESSDFSEMTFTSSLKDVHSNSFLNCNVDILNILVDVEYINDQFFRSSLHIKDFNVAEDNTFYSVKNHCLCSVDNKNLYKVGEMMNPVAVPEGIVEIFDYAIYGKYISKIRIPESVTKINDNALRIGYDNIKIIEGFEGSYAEKYATENNIAFEVITSDDIKPSFDSENSIAKFDLNDDKKVNVMDLLAIKRFLLGV